MRTVETLQASIIDKVRNLVPVRETHLGSRRLPRRRRTDLSGNQVKASEDEPFLNGGLGRTRGLARSSLLSTRC